MKNITIALIFILKTLAVGAQTAPAGDETLVKQALTAMTAHVNGSALLTVEQRNTHLNSVKQNYINNHHLVATEVFAYINAYEANNPPVYQNRQEMSITSSIPEAQLFGILQQSSLDSLNHSCSKINYYNSKDTTSLASTFSKSNARQNQANPPFGGTIFIEPGIITANDPSNFINLNYKGVAIRNVYDRRTNLYEDKNSHIFELIWSDQPPTQAIVNLEFSIQEATFFANKYAFQLGQLPYSMRVGINQIVIHKGLEPWGGCCGMVLIHTDTGLNDYDIAGISEETLVHEASHAALDNLHSSSQGWLAAQILDSNFISEYARDYPAREDIAESFLTWLAVRNFQTRISSTNYDLITQAIPNRILYFDSQGFNLEPMSCTLLCQDTDGDGLTDLRETTLCRNSSNASDFSLDFDHPEENTESFSVNNISNFNITNGICRGNSSGDAHFFQAERYNFVGQSVPRLVVKFKANMASTFQLFWANQDGGFDETRSLSIPYYPSSDWQYLSFDLSGLPQWSSKTIKQLRFDPANGSNVNFEIDWIRSMDYTTCNCSGNITPSLIATEAGWSYYGIANTNEPLLAIEHTPIGGNTMPFTPSIKIFKPCFDTEVYAVKNFVEKEATIVAGNYWQISLTNGSTNGFVNVRYFTNGNISSMLDTESNNFFNTTAAQKQSPSLYFKTNNPVYIPQDIRTDGKGLNYAFSALLPSSSGTFAGKSFVQFNQIPDINNSGGGLLKRVTNLNQNSFMTPEEMQKKKGSLRYNKVNHRFEGFNGSEWIPWH